ncbi:RusA family crossover junction endodeoxyribonuclease [Anaeroarcus burkinensis]|uniref:RusA family crossover junction endodeoxyribonuclease n=1 Tax=Anaeroarcus burkinensis TaxID=82376 RepID=UPI00055C0AEA|nr:RusA family crossover junction endodeoxyribonuclease [Anaeroarcus burkinensis]
MSEGKSVLVLPGRLPGLNEYTRDCRANRQAGAALKRDAEEEIIWEIKRQLRGKRFRRVKIAFRWIEPNQKRDLDNIAFGKKFVLDSLQKSGVLSNDGWRQIAGLADEFEVDRVNPRVVVEIEEVSICVDQGVNGG